MCSVEFSCSDMISLVVAAFCIRGIHGSAVCNRGNACSECKNVLSYSSALVVKTSYAHQSFRLKTCATVVVYCVLWMKTVYSVTWLVMHGILSLVRKNHLPYPDIQLIAHY